MIAESHLAAAKEACLSALAKPATTSPNPYDQFDAKRGPWDDFKPSQTGRVADAAGFDVEGARKAGYSEAEISAYLAAEKSSGHVVVILSCDASDLVTLRRERAGMFDDLIPLKAKEANLNELRNAQMQLLRVETKYDRRVAKDYYGAAFMIFLLGLIPVAWYFVLRRIAEIASAIKGG